MSGIWLTIIADSPLWAISTLGPYIKDVRKFFGIFNPLPLCQHFTQPISTICSQNLTILKPPPQCGRPLCMVPRVDFRFIYVARFIWLHSLSLKGISCQSIAGYNAESSSQRGCCLLRGWVGGGPEEERGDRASEGVKTLSKKVPSSVFSSPSAATPSSATLQQWTHPPRFVFRSILTAWSSAAKEC